MVKVVVNGLMYVLSTGCQWRAVSRDLPPRSTINHYFCRWQHDGTLAQLHHDLYVRCRDHAGREESPTAAIIDSQSIKSTEKGAPGLIGRTSMAAREPKARSAMSWSIRNAS